MKRIMLAIVLVCALMETAVPALAQEEEIPVIFDRSYLESTASLHTEERDEFFRLKSLDFRKSEIALSPDGNWIAFIALPDKGSTTYDTTRDIGIVPVEGGKPVIVYSIPQDQLFNAAQDILPQNMAQYIGEITSIAFTPDSKGITFCREYYDPDKGSWYETDYDYNPNPSGTGSSFLGHFSQGNSVPTIEQVDIATGEVTTIIEEGEEPDWSADGRYLAYIHYDHKYLTDPFTSQHHGVPAIYDTVTGETRFMINDTVEYSDVMMTEDNSGLICVVNNESGNTSIRRIEIETGKEAVLLDDISRGKFLNRVHGGRYITYSDDIDGMLTVMLVDLQANESVHALLDNLSENECGVVTPDGGSLIYLDHYDFEWNSEETGSSVSVRNASRIYRQPIDIEMRFVIGDNPPPEVPNDYGVLAEYGTKMSDLSIHMGGLSMCAPVWSPDGKDIAFLVKNGLTGRIYTVPAEGDEPVLVYDNPGVMYQGHLLSVPGIELCGYSPDGSEILFKRAAIDEARGSVPEITERPDGGITTHWSSPIFYLYGVNVNTGDVRTVVEGADIGAFSPDGRYLAYNVPGYTDYDIDPFIVAHKKQTIIRDLETGEETFLNYRGYGRYHWTRDSKSLIVMSSGNKTLKVPIDGSEPEVIASEDHWFFAVTPDLGCIIYEEQDVLYSTNLDSGEITRITPDVPGDFGPPALSPDGKKLAYIVTYVGKSPSNPFSTDRIDRLFIRDFELQGAIPTAVADAAPAAEPVIANFPNPFNPSTTITFALPGEGMVSLDIYSLSGQKVRGLVNDHLAAGVHEVVWDGRGDSGMTLASGIYIARITAGSSIVARRMLLMK